MLALAAPAAALPAYGTAVDQKCTANGWVPARPYNPNNAPPPLSSNNVNCGLCHANASSPGKTLNNAGKIYKASGRTDVTPFCHVPVAVNHPPVFAVVAAQQATVGQLFQLNVSATDVDHDAIALSVSNSPAGATFTDNGNGTGSFAWTPGAGQTGNLTVTFHATDAGTPMASSTLDVAISVGAVPNHPPVLAAIGDQQVDPGVTLSLTFSATDPDGNALRYAVQPMPSGATLTGAQFAWTPTAGQVGSYPVTVSVTDNGTPAASDSEAIVITVGHVNRPPVLSPIGNRSVDLGQMLRLALVSSDADGDMITLACTGLPSDATLTDMHDGTGEIVWSPTAAGMFSVTCSATDNAMPPGMASETFTLSAHDPAPAAGAPVISAATWHDAGAGVLRVSGDVPAAGMPNGKPPQVEIFAMLADGSVVKLGARAAKGDGSFSVTLPPFIAPCQVAAAANGVMGAPVLVTDAPAQCDTTPLMTVSAKASCDGFTLKVKGRRAPADAVITGLDAATADVLFSQTTTRGGNFRVRAHVDSFVRALNVRIDAGGGSWTLPATVQSCH